MERLVKRKQEKEMNEKREIGKLPNRYWIQTENGWYSVARGSKAHREAEAEKFSGPQD